MVTLYSVDPVSGKATARVVQDVFNLPTAFSYSCEADTLFVAVQRYASNGTANGYIFYSVDVETAQAKELTQSSVRPQDNVIELKTPSI